MVGASIDPGTRPGRHVRVVGRARVLVALPVQKVPMSTAYLDPVAGQQDAATRFHQRQAAG
jgi:hypothetical protein